MIHAVALAGSALTLARTRAVSIGASEHRLQVDLERARTEIALATEESAIKDARWSRLKSRRRPQNSPIERLRILELKVTHGWSRDEAVARFLIDEQATQIWLRRVDEGGEKALLQLDGPVNRFPELVRRLKTLVPTVGKVRIAQEVARAGLHLGATTASRFLRDKDPLSDRDGQRD